MHNHLNYFLLSKIFISGIIKNIHQRTWNYFKVFHEIVDWVPNRNFKKIIIFLQNIQTTENFPLLLFWSLISVACFKFIVQKERWLSFSQRYWSTHFISTNIVLHAFLSQKIVLEVISDFIYLKILSKSFSIEEH